MGGDLKNALARERNPFPLSACFPIVDTPPTREHHQQGFVIRQQNQAPRRLLGNEETPYALARRHIAACHVAVFIKRNQGFSVSREDHVSHSLTIALEAARESHRLR